MMMPGRIYSTEDGYRYGFNGKENDNEVKGEGNQHDYGMRIYDPRLGRFLSVDPLTKDFPMLTPYQFASNSPVANIDLDGLEAIGVNPKTGEVIMGPLDVSTLRSQGWKTKMLANYKPSPSLFQPQISNKPQLQVATESTGQGRAARDIALRRDAPSPLPKRTTTMDEAPPKTPSQKRNEDLKAAFNSAQREKQKAAEEDHRLSDDFPIIGGFVKAGRQAMNGRLLDAAQLTTQAGVELLVVYDGAVPLNRLNHIFGKAEHALEPLVAKFGTQERAFLAVQSAANEALQAGKLIANEGGILPKVGEILNVGGINVRLIGGKVEKGKVTISSFSSKNL